MPNQRPNILLITTDQQRFDTIHCRGNGSIFTPHLNYLSRTGITFTNAYADCPICMPSRATIMSGKHGYKQGFVDNGKSNVIDSDHSMPGILTKVGYQTRAIGKMHFAPPRNHNGFEHMEILNDYYRWMDRDHRAHVPMDHGIAQNELEPTMSTVPEHLSLTRWIIDRSVEFLDTRDPTRPFFLWTSITKPHPPLDPDKKYWDIYDGIDLPEPIYGDWSENVEDIPESLLESSKLFTDAQDFSKQQLRNIRRAYYACISQLDYNLGYLIAYMKEKGLMDDALIIFTSDHGEMLGDHHMGFKSVFLEGSAHVPMIMRPPKDHPLSEEAGTSCEEIVCLADLIPTFATAAGIELSDEGEYDGIDLTSIASGEKKREKLAGSCGNQYHMLLKDGYKYHFSIKGGDELLFDLEKDPYEQKNLANLPEFADRKLELRAELVDSLRESNFEYVVDGDLATSEWKPNRKKNPGFHTRHWPSDLTH